MKRESRIRSGFNLLAPFYDILVRMFFFNSIRKIQTHFLSELKDANSILIFGGGTGDILIESLNINVSANYCYVDISNRMIEQTKAKITTGNIEFIEGSYSDIPAKEFDVIITPFVLDCFSDQELKSEVIPLLKKHLTMEGRWLFSDFRYSSIYSQMVIRFLYFFFNLTTGLGLKKLPDFKKAFIDHSLTESKIFAKGMLISSIYLKK